MLMSEKKTPNWLRGLEIVLGFIAVILGIAVLVMPDVAVETLIFLLYFALFFIGVGRILVGALFRRLERSLRVLNIIVGLVLIAVAITIIAYQYPYFATAFMVSLLAYGLLVDGIIRIVVGAIAKVLPNWIRGSFVVLGILMIISAIVVLAYPDVGVLTLVFLLSIGLLWGGIDAIIAGATGEL
jgi:uncharacterized membrane protein HdeD (DUF308 family)